MAVILTVFVVQVALHLVNAVGGSAVNNLLWNIFSLLPNSPAKDEQDVRRLRREVVRLHREMSAVSAQDDFAKWARLRREHDRAKEKHDKRAAETRTLRVTFDRIVGVLRFLSVQGFNFFLNSYYSKTPMFWLPQGWVPYHVEWLLSFPRAPLGSISVNVWAIACGTVVAMVSEALRATWALRTGKAQETSSKSGSADAAHEKKEL